MTLRSRQRSGVTEIGNFPRRPAAFRLRIVAQSPQHERLCFDPELKMLSNVTVRDSLKLRLRAVPSGSPVGKSLNAEVEKMSDANILHWLIGSSGPEYNACGDRRWVIAEAGTLR